jgi:hypothetical protein
VIRPTGEAGVGVNVGSGVSVGVGVYVSVGSEVGVAVSVVVGSGVAVDVGSGLSVPVGEGLGTKVGGVVGEGGSVSEGIGSAGFSAWGRIPGWHPAKTTANSPKIPNKNLMITATSLFNIASLYTMS